ncbi:cation exchanger family protein [Cucumis melo var. makuwa]|uniref:Uncharacterized protein LOC103483591 n=2 Tax=Cucumis melo TaxID=3656 RepID=A0A1S3AWP3_CUCME|nr:uncharacterized protein LOC103483591 [Cucumis melo]XP_008438520.1 uncharacterized protein LOC103483591 [Cucumis melo]XP_008438521.1 uncharacterized protein LOC103483591 [Cucumis melo]XP_008438522.1 uncharacterized protein LOC103483591 [Cucumis melo]KAA0049251.1 cation exchanger family protein [Cucumis melo var. makuwa]TYK17307.1 cation exchanger family protein [Cucumis melo var. makuwa]
MGLSKTEINLKRLLATAPHQKDQAKLIHYVTTLREQLEQLAEEKTPEGLSRVSKALLGDYSEKIEAIASKLIVPLPDVEESSEPSTSTSVREISSVAEGDLNTPSSPTGLRRRFPASSTVEDRSHGTIKEDSSAPVKLDAAAINHIEKHRKLQEDLTDEMVGLAKQLKESSLIMSKSLENTEKILDSTEKAVEDSLATTGRVNKRAVQIYSESSKTSCFTWLAIFAMTCIFIMVVLLIRVT